MVETKPHPASPTHLPWFITEPGQADKLMLFTGAFLLVFIAIVGVLMLRLHYLPQQLVSQEEKAKYQVVATLCLLAIFSPGNFFWIAALLVAMTDIPDFSIPFRRIAEAVRRIADSRETVDEIQRSNVVDCQRKARSFPKAANK